MRNPLPHVPPDLRPRLDAYCSNLPRSHALRHQWSADGSAFPNQRLIQRLLARRLRKSLEKRLGDNNRPWPPVRAVHSNGFGRSWRHLTATALGQQAGGRNKMIFRSIERRQKVEPCSWDISQARERKQNERRTSGQTFETYKCSRKKTSKEEFNNTPLGHKEQEGEDNNLKTQCTRIFLRIRYTYSS